MPDAMKIPGFVAAYLRPLFLEGRGPFRWTCTCGEAADLARLDELVLEMFPDDEIRRAGSGSRASTCRSRGCRRASAISASASASDSGWPVNELVATGAVRARSPSSRDNLDSRVDHQPDVRVREHARRVAT